MSKKELEEALADLYRDFLERAVNARGAISLAWTFAAAKVAALRRRIKK